MNIPSRIVGVRAGPLEHDVDARWLMSYSAGLGETDPRCYDTASPAGPLAHPLFPVCYEWPVSQPIRQVPELREHFPRLVHAEHDLRLHRLPRAGDRLATTARIVSVQSRKPGAFVVFRFETAGARGEPVSTTDFGALYRGVAVEGKDQGEACFVQDTTPKAEPRKAADLSIPFQAAHVYTECARIFNPIHTDVAHARAAGLPDIILHGTATLALSISAVLKAHAIPWDKTCRVACRFSGMVLMPSTLEVFASAAAGVVQFETRKPSGEAVITRGRIEHHG